MIPTKILIIRLSSLGDIIHTFPMISDLKLNYPNSIIDWLVDDNFSDLVKFSINIDNVLSIPLRKWKKNKFTLIKNLFLWYKSHNFDHYDYIVDSQGLLKSAILAKCFKGKIYGYSKDSVKEKLASLFYDYKIYIPKDIFAINKNRLLSSKIFNYDSESLPINFGVIDKIENNDLIYHNYVIFFHCTSMDNKKMPQLLWKDFASYLINKYDLNIIIPYGNTQEKEDSLSIAKTIGSNNVVVPESILSYNQIFTLINNANFILGVDTGLIHLSNALRKKLIALFISTNSKKTGVYETEISKNLDYISNEKTLSDIINCYETIRKT